MSNMVVQTNVMAINSHRNLGIVGRSQARASERLSSGFRVNRAADDAAGLAISEKMRGQIRSLDQASRNAQDGVSLIQTAEGAMSIINDMVIRIRELVVQAANDTNAHDETGNQAPGASHNMAQSDRLQIQREINALLAEIDTTAERTQFNTRHLINGALAGEGALGLPTGATQADVAEFLAEVRDHADWTAYDAATAALATGQARVENAIANHAALTELNAQVNAVTTAVITAFIASLSEEFAELYLAGNTTHAPDLHYDTQLDFVLYRIAERFGATLTAGDLFDDPDDWSGFNGSVTLDGNALTAIRDALAADGFDAITWRATEQVEPAIADVTALGSAITTAGTEIGAAAGAIGTLNSNVATTRGTLDARVYYITDGAFATYAELAAAGGANGVISGDGLWFQVGANMGQGVRLTIQAVDVAALDGVPESFNVPQPLENPEFRFGYLRNNGLEMDTGIMRENGENISLFLESIDLALAHVAGERAHLGAMQNRLEFTIESLDISSENLSAANSRIRDADMAAEMMRFTQSNVLQQAAISMLAQANQAPQSILQLLR